MAKRKRLSPVALVSETGHAAPEVKSASGAMPPSLTRRAPIAAVAGEASAEAALAEVSREMAEARAEGRLAQALPLGSVVVDHLARDRLIAEAPAGADEDMTALVESLRARGQQMPIEVIDLGEGRYGLISGWRRLAALKRLHAETAEPRFANVLAVERAPADAGAAYISMVEENEIRVGLSYYERARIAAQAVARGAFETEKKALLALYATASRAKRSKIRAFLPIVAAFDGLFAFPAALPERLGLLLSKRLEAEPALKAEIAAALKAAAPQSAEAEQAVIRSVLAGEMAGDPERPLSPGATPKDSRTGTHWIAVEQGHGTITLRGPGVTKALRRDLNDWLKRRRAI